jgi:two-component system nitrogen regulation response regulator GlnG
MAAGREVHLADLPPELGNTPDPIAVGGNSGWREQLHQWASEELSGGTPRLLDRATPEFERVMIDVALAHTQGRKKDAAELLGWGRNTLTRKMKELEM